MRMSLRQCIARYGNIHNNKWRDEGKWMAMVVLPLWAAKKLTNSATGRPTTRIYMNKDMHQPFLKALEAVKAAGLDKELKTFDGCFMIRNVRGSIGMSTHSYGLAIDLNAKENGLGAKPKLSAAFVKCFTDQGFTWGGNFPRKDGMHLSYAWE